MPVPGKKEPRPSTPKHPRFHKSIVPTALALAALAAAAHSAHAEIYRWDNNQLIPGTVGINPAPGVNLSSMSLQVANLNNAQLQSASLFSTDLTSAHLLTA